jgi:hypothetical protein
MTTLADLVADLADRVSAYDRHMSRVLSDQPEPPHEEPR